MFAVLQNSTISTLSPVQAQVIRALAQGTTITAAAKLAGVHRTTLYNWFDQPAFAAAMREARQEYSDFLHNELQELASLALSQLRALLENPDTPPSVRLRACLAILHQHRWTFPQLPRHPRQNEPNSTFFDTLSDPRADPEPAPEQNEPDSTPATTPFLRNEPKNSESVDSKGFFVPLKPAARQNSTHSTPRNAPCPCGSGLKFKRCCGPGALPSLHTGSRKSA